jgi:hypothetical protein
VVGLTGVLSLLRLLAVRGIHERRMTAVMLMGWRHTTSVLLEHVDLSHQIAIVCQCSGVGMVADAPSHTIGIHANKYPLESALLACRKSCASALTLLSFSC